MATSDYHVFELGTVHLQTGGVLHDAKLAFKTYGTLNAGADNAVLLPTFYTGSHVRNEGFFGRGRAIDPARHFVVSINLFGNGISTSPSNAAPAQRAASFPRMTLLDNVSCQYRLLTQALGVKRLALVAGWSLAGCQAYHWAALYPEMVDAIVPFCASARTSAHNFVFLEGVKAALVADQSWNDGAYTSPPVAGLKAFGRVYAGWAYSQTFFRQNLYRRLGHDTVEDLLVDWELDHVRNWDANDLLAKLWTWQMADISANDMYRSDFTKALGAIGARAILVPCTQDLYFPPADNEIEVRSMPRAELRPFDSPFGHCVANPGNDHEFERFLDTAIHDAMSGV
ncbi:MAG: alpha/beta fold hydrolase [Parvibaculaceae bacterium]